MSDHCLCQFRRRSEIVRLSRGLEQPDQTIGNVSVNDRCLLFAQHTCGLFGRPYKELAFLALAVGILCRIKRTRGVEHLAFDVFKRLDGDASVSVLAGYLK